MALSEFVLYVMYSIILNLFAFNLYYSFILHIWKFRILKKFVVPWVHDHANTFLPRIQNATTWHREMKVGSELTLKWANSPG